MSQISNKCVRGLPVWPVGPRPQTGPGEKLNNVSDIISSVTDSSATPRDIDPCPGIFSLQPT